MATPALSAAAALAELQRLGSPDDAVFLQGYFKTGPGQYGEGDRFLGIRVPVLRKLARKHRDMPLAECLVLLAEPYHEARLLALLILVEAYRRGDEEAREAVFRAYLENTARINNWDLVDLSAPHIVGVHLWRRERPLLRELASSPMLWERRIAVLATFHFIKQAEYSDSLRLAQLLLEDREDLIHKAVGWMLREVGQRDLGVLQAFLRKHYARMPRTMLRYAIEKFPPEERQRYLKGLI